MKLQTALAKGEWVDASRAEEVWVLQDQLAALAATSRERIGKPGESLGAKNISIWMNAGLRSRRWEPSLTRTRQAGEKAGRLATRPATRQTNRQQAR